MAAVIPAEEKLTSRLDPRARLGAVWRHALPRALLKDAVKKYAMAFKELLPAIPLAERFNNAPINDQKRVAG